MTKEELEERALRVFRYSETVSRSLTKVQRQRFWNECENVFSSQYQESIIRSELPKGKK